MENEEILHNDAEGENGFKFPLNIKQMGNTDKEVKIYVEDYVHTYLYRYGKTMAKKEKLAVLAGRYYRIDGQDTVVISAAIQGMYTINENGNEIFTDETWDYVDEQMDKYFSDLFIVGWVRIQNEYGTLMMAKDEEFHKKCFKYPWQVFFVMDTAEMQDGFYIFNNGMSSLRRLKGYFIYYDKNENMQNYMIENNFVKAKDNIEETECKNEDMPSGKTAVQRLLNIRNHIETEKNIVQEEHDFDRVDAAKKIRKLLNKKKLVKEKKERINVAATVCTVLCFACVAMCAGMLSEKKQIRYLEDEMAQVKSSYIVMEEKINDTRQVFSVQQNTAEVKKEEKKDEIKTYTVKQGDTLWQISRDFYNGENRVEAIRAFNDIEDENELYVGQKINLPQ